MHSPLPMKDTESTYKNKLLSLVVQHGQVEVDELKVGRGRCVVSSSQL